MPTPHTPERPSVSPFNYAPVAVIARAQAELLAQMMSANMRLWQAAHDAAWAAARDVATTPTSGGDVSPCISHAFADLQDCRNAIIQAQVDALEAARRTSSTAISPSRA